MRKPAKHGTRSGYNKHRQNDETPCPACKQAEADYQRERRATNPQVRAVQAARWRATARLVNMHPGTFRALVAEELAR